MNGGCSKVILGASLEIWLRKRASSSSQQEERGHGKKGRRRFLPHFISARAPRARQSVRTSARRGAARSRETQPKGLIEGSSRQPPRALALVELCRVMAPESFSRTRGGSEVSPPSGLLHTCLGQAYPPIPPNTPGPSAPLQ
ncbi:unnamed protein product [Lota lota]